MSVCLTLELSLLLILLFLICWGLGNQATEPIGTVCKWGLGLPELVPRGSPGTGFVPTFQLLTARLLELRWLDGMFQINETLLYLLPSELVVSLGEASKTMSCEYMTWSRRSWHRDAALESRKSLLWQLWPKSCKSGSRGQGRAMPSLPLGFIIISPSALWVSPLGAQTLSGS